MLPHNSKYYVPSLKRNKVKSQDIGFLTTKNQSKLAMTIMEDVGGILFAFYLMFCEIGVLKTFAKFAGNTCVGVSFLIELHPGGLQLY